MHVPRRPFEAIWNRRHANDTIIFCKKEFKKQAGSVGRAAAEAAALSLVRHWGQFPDRHIHIFRIPKPLQK
jgi:hypothetical protein